MRQLHTRKDLLASGIASTALERMAIRGELQRIIPGIFVAGDDPITAVEHALASVLKADGIASHFLAGVLHEFDSVALGLPFLTVATGLRKAATGIRYRDLEADAITVVNGFPCTNGLQTLLDLAAVLDDITWEHALEFALRETFTTIAEIEALLPSLSTARMAGIARIRRVLALRPDHAPATESLLETLMVQLIRAEPRLPEPQRQVEVFKGCGEFVARVDLAWPDVGVFIELDGQQHKDQPVYDARRETDVVATTGWLPGRFTWHEVTRAAIPTARRLVEIHAAAHRTRNYQ